MSCLIVFRTMTQAQHVASILINKKVLAKVIRPPLEAGKGSCSAAIKIPDSQLSLAVALISKLSFTPVAYYKVMGNGSLIEVFP